MTGPRERPNTQPREKRTAAKKDRSSRNLHAYRQERAAVLMLYAGKIAAAQLYAAKHELSAILAALRDEERAALRVLQDQEQMKAATRRMKRLAWNVVSRVATRPKIAKTPDRPAAQAAAYRVMRPRIR